MCILFRGALGGRLFGRMGLNGLSTRDGADLGKNLHFRLRVGERKRGVQFQKANV